MWFGSIDVAIKKGKLAGGDRVSSGSRDQGPGVAMAGAEAF